MDPENRNNLSMYVDANRAQSDSGISDFSIERYGHAAVFLEPTLSTVVDVGCNTGIGASVLRTACPNAVLIGIEVVPERAQEARGHFDVVHESVATRLPFEDRSVDAVLCLEVIEHRTEAEEVRRVLRPDGRFILTTPNSQYIKLLFLRRSVLDDPSHLSEYFPRKLSKLLRQNGFSIYQLEGTGRVSRYLGRRRHGFRLFGSFMLVGDRR